MLTTTTTTTTLNGWHSVFLFRIYLSALNKIQQRCEWKNRVYLVPDHVAIYPVAYNLPKSESYMRRDVLR